MTSNLPPQLIGINRPPQLILQGVHRLTDFLEETASRQLQGNEGSVFFGTAFLQGGRIQFTGAMPFHKLLQVAEVDQFGKGAGIEEVASHANRATNQTHAKKLRDYLKDTACIGQPFILPSFTLNWGVDMVESAPSALLMLHVPSATDDSAVVWTAMLVLPQRGQRMKVTDGSHRFGKLADLRDDTRIPQENRDELMMNAADVKVVFESSLLAAHQDFADCGRARPIEKSLLSALDLRDTKNRAATTLVERTPMLKRFVDATAAHVNLSAGSKKVWSMSAVRNFVSLVAETRAPLKPDEATADATQWFAALTKHVPQFVQLMNEKKTAAELRALHGGDILMRGVGMTFMGLAYLACVQRDIAFADMAKRFGRLDWSLLDCERDDVDHDGRPLIRFGTSDFVTDLTDHVLPDWKTMVAIQGDNRYRIFATQDMAQQVWDQKLAPQLFPEVFTVPTPLAAD